MGLVAQTDPSSTAPHVHDAHPTAVTPQALALAAPQGLHGATANQWVAQLIAASGADRVALADSLRTSRMLRNRDVWLALQQQLGNEQALQVMTAASNPEPLATREMVTSAVLTEAVHREVFGVRITASAGCHPEALDKAVAIVTAMIGNNLYAQQKLADKKLTFVIIPSDVAMTALPEFSGLVGQSTFDGRPWEGVRGVGRKETPDGRVAIAAGEETLIGVASTRASYPAGYSVGQHEFAHVLQLDGMTRQQRGRVTELFEARTAADPGNRNGTWSDQYADENEREYFAQSSNVFFGTNKMGSNHNGREWLQQNDPGMYAFLVELYERSHDRRGRLVESDG